jgi:transcriptional regulator with XRE-family HTH domain
MLRRRRLGAELKRSREAAGLTQEQVSRQFEWHAAKMTRIETAKVSVTARDVKDLLDLYGVRDRRYRDALVEMARSSRARAWWAEYSVQPDSFVSLEAEASAMRNWEPAVLPGLLQTEAYMRALFSKAVAAGRRMSVDRAVSLRLARQRRLTGDHPLELFAVIDESVIRRQIGGESVMAEQLRHLIAVSELPNVSLQILPYSVGAHPLLATSLAILEFQGAADLDVVYMEGHGRPPHYIKEQVEVGRHREQFERLSMVCLDHSRTTNMIRKS